MSTGSTAGADRGERIRPSFATAESRLTVYDPIERRQVGLELGGPTSTESVSPDRFRAPVDAGVAIETDSLTFPNVVNVVIRDRSGTLVAQTDVFGDERVPTDAYSIEVDAVVKLYLQVDGAVRCHSDAQRTYLEFEDDVELLVGARSRHGRPAATITVGDSPRDAMAAVSAFGSALKTTSPERSYPTLRGHLPLLERGADLDVPSVLEVPDTGIELAVPPRYRYVYPASPLAFYLGADVVPGESPTLRTETGFSYPLAEGAEFERTVERLLKHVFVLDCVTRTEGLYPIDLYERAELAGRVDVDPAALYELPPAERLAAYLELPLEAVAPLVPRWRLVTQLEPDAQSVEVLPFVVDDLAVVRTPGRDPGVPVSAQEAAVGEFLRGGADALGESVETPAPDEDVTVRQQWIGEGESRQTNEATLTAFRNRLARDPSTGPIEIAVVCNDPAMADEQEDVVDEVYGTRDRLPYDVDVQHDLSVDALRDRLQQPTDFLHYIGHIDDAGVECADGRLDVATLPSVGVNAFLLNACQSYRQGMELVQRGSIGGVVTRSDVVNRGAVEVGSTLARLLNRGFPLRPALSVARTVSVVGAQYLVVGDGGLSIAQPDGPPNSCRLEDDGDDYLLTMDSFPSGDRGMGTIIQPLIEREDRFFLLSSEHIQYELDREELGRFLSLDTVPLRYRGELYWSSEVDVENL